MKSSLALRSTPLETAMVTTNAVEATAAWDAGTLYVALDERRDDTTHRIYRSAIGAVLGAATITIASPGVVTFNGHGLAANSKVAFKTTGALPTGLAASTIYYVQNPTTNTFQLSAAAGGSAINTIGSQGGIHTLYSNPNLGYDPSDPANLPQVWIDVRPTNDWAAFDAVKSTQTTRTGSLTFTLRPGSPVDAIGLAKVKAKTATFTSNDGSSDIYSAEVDLVAADGIDNWYDYFFQERVQQDTVFLSDLPAIADPRITVTLEGADPELSEVAIGACQIGRQLAIGSLTWGTTQGFTSYSSYEEDGYGGEDITPRGDSLWEEFQLYVLNSRVKYVRDQVLAYRDTPIFFQLAPDLVVFGFIKRFDREIKFALDSLISGRVEETLE